MKPAHPKPPDLEEEKIGEKEVVKTDFVEGEIKDFVRNYFDALMRRDLDLWSKKFDSKIYRFYDLQSPTINKIVENQRNFYSVYKFDRISIDWVSLRYEKVNLDFLVTFDLNYKNKRNERDQFKNYDLTLTMLLSKNYKIKSIYEMKN